MYCYECLLTIIDYCNYFRGGGEGVGGANAEIECYQHTVHIFK